MTYLCIGDEVESRKEVGEHISAISSDLKQTVSSLKQRSTQLEEQIVLALSQQRQRHDDTEADLQRLRSVAEETFRQLRGSLNAEKESREQSEEGLRKLLGQAEDTIIRLKETLGMQTQKLEEALTREADTVTELQVIPERLSDCVMHCHYSR